MNKPSSAAALRLENEAIALLLDPHSGAWIGWVDQATGEQLVVQPIPGVPAGLAQARPEPLPAAGSGPLPPAEPEAQVLSHKIDPAQRALDLVLRAGDWLVQATYRLSGDRGLLWRSFTLENAGSQARVLRGVGCLLPALTAGPDSVAIRPDTKRVGDLPLEMIARRDPDPAPKDGLFYLWSVQAGRGLGAWFHNEEEFTSVAASATGSGAQLTHRSDLQVKLKPGERVRLGTQYLWLNRGSRDELLRSVRQVFERIDLRAPNDSIPDLGKSVLYCGHPGGTPEQKFIGYGGFKAVQAYLPTLRRMGVNLLWLLPIFEHGDGKKWNLYSPFNHTQISALYGTEEELRALLGACAEAGIRVVFDLVPHGPPEDSELGRAHPEWVCLDEAGKPVLVWSQLAFDNAHPEWQDHMRHAAEFNSRKFGIVGARIDVATGSPPNWNPLVPYRPSFSTLGGGLGMCKAIREGFRRVRPDAFVLPEEYTAARVFYRSADLTYDVSLFLVFIDLQARKVGPEEWAATLQRFLHDQALTLPPGALKMRWTGNHDTVSWTIKKERPRKTFGEARARALISLCCLIDGVPMIYQGEEDPALFGGEGPSTVNHLAALSDCRRRIPALSGGAAEYQAAQASDGVFASLRGSGEGRVLVLVSLNPGEVQSRLRLPPDLQSVAAWKDELTGEAVLPAGVPMGDHQVRVLSPKTTR